MHPSSKGHAPRLRKERPVQPATELVLLFAPPPQQRRRHQLTGRARSPRSDRTEFIPNGSWASRPAAPDDEEAGRAIGAVLSRDRSALWLRNASVGTSVLMNVIAAAPGWRNEAADGLDDGRVAYRAIEHRTEPGSRNRLCAGLS